jgi:hypothetical protein
MAMAKSNMLAAGITHYHAARRGICDKTTPATVQIIFPPLLPTATTVDQLQQNSIRDLNVC